MPEDFQNFPVSISHALQLRWATACQFFEATFFRSKVPSFAMGTQTSVLLLGHKVSTFTWVDCSSGSIISSIFRGDLHSLRLLRWAIQLSWSSIPRDFRAPAPLVLWISTSELGPWNWDETFCNFFTPGLLSGVDTEEGSALFDLGWHSVDSLQVFTGTNFGLTTF